MKTFLEEFERHQYKDQANLVFLGSVFSTLALIPVFIIIDQPVVLLFHCLTMTASVVAYFVNQQKHYALAPAIFLIVATVQSLVEVVVFGVGLGFEYYFFNFAGLIIYTNWKGRYQLGSIVILSMLFIGVIMHASLNPPMTPLNPFITSFFIVINIILNITGVANSAFYYVRIVNRAQQKLEQAALTDFLTSLPNRVAFDRFITSDRVREHHQSTGMGILMMDVDHFKSINDTYGHVVGDEVLRKISTVLANETRTTDIVARYGGEEFVHALVTPSLEELQSVAERLRETIQNLTFTDNEHTFSVTMSIGALFCPSTCKFSVDSALSRADELLYQAKENGRNQVVHESLE